MQSELFVISSAPLEVVEQRPGRVTDNIASVRHVRWKIINILSILKTCQLKCFLYGESPFRTLLMYSVYQLTRCWSSSVELRSLQPFSVIRTGGLPYVSLMYTSSLRNPHGTIFSQSEPVLYQEKCWFEFRTLHVHVQDCVQMVVLLPYSGHDSSW